MQYYEYHKNHILEKIDAIQSTIFKRLLPVYDSIESEANAVAEAHLNDSSIAFNPDTMDTMDAYQQAWEEGGQYYTMQHAMKTELLRNTATWLFHLFEKDCREMCPYADSVQLKSNLEKIGIDCSDQSDWYKINTELRLVANTIKHGEGRSSQELRRIRPEYFNTQLSYLTDSLIEVNPEDIRSYITHMQLFWNSFFNKVLLQV